jgi:hypothetical protein
MEDLEEAIVHGRQALDLCPPGHPHHSSFYHNLATTMSTRFDKLGKMEDLEQSVDLLCDAQKALHPDHPNHSTINSQLAFMVVQLCHHSQPLA